MEANRTTPAYELKDDLARLCLPGAGHKPDRKLAWANSVCLLFLLIGLAGTRRGLIAIKPAPPLTTAVPMVTEPMTLPPQETTEKKAPRQEENDTPRVNVVIPSSPSVNFSVPTVGAVVAPTSLAVAPPLEPMRTVTEIGSLNNTGAGGDRPQPAYPTIAKEMGEQGTVQLLMEGDAEGNILSVEVTASSGFPVLDRATVEFIKRHWRLPAGPEHRRFESSITYRLQF